MSKQYTSIQQNIDRKCAESFSRETLVDFYCRYKKLSHETEFYNEEKIWFKAEKVFGFLMAYATSCLCLVVLNKNITLINLFLQSIIPAAVASVVILVIKQFIVHEYAHYKNKNIPLPIYVILFVLIPIVIKIIL